MSTLELSYLGDLRTICENVRKGHEIIVAGDFSDADAGDVATSILIALDTLKPVADQLRKNRASDVNLTAFEAIVGYSASYLENFQVLFFTKDLSSMEKTWEQNYYEFTEMGCVGAQI